MNPAIISGILQIVTALPGLIETFDAAYQQIKGMVDRGEDVTVDDINRICADIYANSQKVQAL